MEKIKFKDLEWYVLEKDEENIKLLLVDVLDEEHIKKYVDDEWYRDGCEVRHSSNVRAGQTWEDSYIKNVVLENFKKDLEIDCEVTLLTKNEIENLDKEIKCCNAWYWTKTVIKDDIWFYFALVSHYGDSIDSFASSSVGVRPVLSTKISNLTHDSVNKLPEKIGKIDDNDGYIDQNDVIKIARKFDEIIDYLKRSNKC